MVEFGWLLTIVKPTCNWRQRQIKYHISLLYFKDWGTEFYAKVGNLWGYHQLRLTEDSFKVTAIITPWGVYIFLACPVGTSTIVYIDDNNIW